MCDKLGQSTDVTLSNSCNVVQTPHRMEIPTTDAFFIIDDSYNASEKGIEGCCETLLLLKRQKNSYFSGIVECGKMRDIANVRCGKNLGDVCDVFVAVGKNSDKLLKVRDSLLAKSCYRKKVYGMQWKRYRNICKRTVSVVSKRFARCSQFTLRCDMNILLVYGGNSCEHDISVITACLAKGYFDGNLYSAYFTQDNRCFLVDNALTPAQTQKRQVQKFFGVLTGDGQNRHFARQTHFQNNIRGCGGELLHGRCGEDGTLAALCKLCNLPLVGSDIVASAIAMDKVLCKRVLQSMNFPVVEGVELTNDNVSLARCQQQLGFPVIVKPATLGSSIRRFHLQRLPSVERCLPYRLFLRHVGACERGVENFYELNWFGNA